MSFIATIAKIYIDEDVQKYKFTQTLLSRCQQIEQEVIAIEEKESFFKQSQLTLTQGKRVVYLTKHQGTTPELCPGFSETMLCCNYYVMNFAENCPLECSYCILQAFLNHNFLTLHVNVEEQISKLETFLLVNINKQFRIGTGEHSDSLALEPIFPIASFLIEKFASFSNAVLELKTKTDNIESLLNLQHKGKTILAWSLNASYIIEQEEQKTASLEARLQAAKQATQAGYKVAFHFDPLFHFEGYEEAYIQVITKLFDTVPKDRIAWISLGTLRYLPILKQIATERFKKTSIYSRETITTPDGKIRYIKPIRKELVQVISQAIYKRNPQATVYLCMEKHSVWNTMPYHPEDHIKLDSILWQSYEK